MKQNKKMLTFYILRHFDFLSTYKSSFFLNSNKAKTKSTQFKNMPHLVQKIVLFSLFATLLLSDFAHGVRKIRYKKARNHGNAKKSAGFLTDEEEVFGFLSRIRPTNIQDLTPYGFIPEYDDPSAYTTPTPTPTTTTTTTTTTATTTTSRPVLKTVNDYCLKPRGQFGYDPGKKKH